MKQKIVINLQMPCEKCRSKAMKIAVKADGVTKVEIEAGKDKLTVIGDGVDSVKLTRKLRKNLGWASILGVEEEKDKDKKEKEEKAKEEIQWLMNYHRYPAQYVVCEESNPNVCSVV